jgi:calcineurin-like phosphoesterase family protein
MNVFFITDLHISATPPSSRKDDFLSSVCGKVSYVTSLMEPDDWMIFGGDVFNTSSVPENAVNSLLEALPANVATIVGNHDMNRRSRYGFNSTSLSLLINSGRIRHLTKHPMVFHGLNLVGYDYNDDISLADVSGNIVVAHKFICRDDTLYDKSEIWSYADIERQKPHLILSGHDHVPYDGVICGDSRIIRPGALSRGTVHQYNRERDVFAVRLSVVDGEISPLMIRVPCLSPDEVFYTKNDDTQEVDRISLTDFLKSATSAAEFGTIDLHAIVSAMNLADDERETLNHYAARYGVIL